ncbi:unnamed protein product [Penicillium salamii]|uniref:MFS general substrate transporter n=1 Tax=Penicillium salamii TaxID=1612424 RepID=A0A9W4NID6_9EURO|nr:unnamed protein product [Penicillium salamii]
MKHRPRGFRLFIAFVANTAVFLSQLISAGPSVTIMNMVHDLFNATPTNPKYPTLVAKVSYFFSGMVFLQSMSNLFYMPVIIKYGRRPVYIVSLLVFGACSLWAGLAKSYPSELAARLALGFAGGSADSLAPLTITDIFFLHERGFIMSLKIFNGPFTKESLWQLFWRPVRLLLLPPVLWGTLAQSVCISALVAVTTSSQNAFSKTYHWSVWQCGLAYIATIIGSLLSIFGSGWLSDTTADWLTRRNHGLREPEMRLPALILCSILCPLGIVLYGLGIGHGLPWIVPVLGLALWAFGFLLSFYTNPWIESAGYSTSFGIQAGINAAVLIMWVPLYIWGKRIRAWYMQLSLARYVQWKSDREVGE